MKQGSFGFDEDRPAMRMTSIEAYREIEAKGLLSLRRWEIYRILFEHGPLTASEVAIRMPGESPPRGRVGNVGARLTEMRSMGVVAEIGTARCPISGRNVIRWEVTATLPALESHQ